MDIYYNDQMFKTYIDQSTETQTINRKGRHTYYTVSGPNTHMYHFSITSVCSRDARGLGNLLNGWKVVFVF